MLRIMKLKLIFPALCAFLLSACAGTGFGDFIGNTGSKTPTTCPQVGVLEDAKYLTLLRDPNKLASAVRSVSEIRDFDGGCDYKSDKVVVDLDLYISTELGERARIRENDKVSIILPYFIAITDPYDGIVAKEVFAAAIRFEEDENTQEQVERLRQVIPLSDITLGPEYKIFAGFQLTQAQLDYNRTQKANWTPDVEDPRPKF